MYKKILTFWLILSSREIFCCDFFPPDATRFYSTTVCTNLTSLTDIPYSPKDGTFEQYLEITHSNIPTIKNFTFVKFSTIDKLYLTQNHIEKIEVDAFMGLKELKELHLDLNVIKEVSEIVYNPLKKLEILNLANNKITHIFKEAFIGLEVLAEIHLENNFIKIVDEHVFDSQKHLQLLDLSGNPLKVFNGEGIQCLSALILSETSLTQFDNDLKHLSMEILNISSSHLENIDFGGFPSVDKIHLSSNKLVSIVNLEKLDSTYVTLDNNQIKTISGSFNDISFVTLKYNKLEILNNTLFNKSASVRFIDLGYNLISVIEKDTFRNLAMLEILHLDYNKISDVDPMLFTDLIELKYLDISHNNIKDLQYGTFNNLIQLKVLNISGNKLKSLHENGLLAVISLEEIIFHNNQIAYLDVDTLLKFKSQLKTVSLNHNAWDCEGIAETYLKFATNHTINLPGLSEEGENFHGIACSSKSNNWKDTEISKFFNEDFKKSKFFQFFEKVFKESDFFKFLEGYKSVGRTEKLVTFEERKRDSMGSVLLFSAAVQVVVVVLLVMNFWRRNRNLV